LERLYQYRPGRFFLIAYVATWIPWCVGINLGTQPGLEAYASLLSLVGLLGPIGATLFMVFSWGSAALKCDFKDRLFNLRRIRPLYAILAVVLPFAVILIAILLSIPLGESSNQFQLAGGASLLPLIILAMILAPIMEETGWHGYGVDSLRAYHGMMRTTLLFAVLWTAWHAPLFLISGTYQNAVAAMENKIYVANFFVSIIPAAIIANWFYYKNDRSIAIAILVHSMLNAAAVLLNTGQVAKCIATLLYACVAAGLILGDRKLFAEGPRNFLSKANPVMPAQAGIQ
jgi:membrane protease YdiL (CAAX protease family)